MRTLSLVPCLVLALWAPAALCAPPTERLAILVAHAEGGPDTEPLRFPHIDALKVGAVLTELGGFDPTQLIMLVSPSAAEVEAALATARGRVESARARGSRTLLLFYYSGHAAAGDLRLGADRLPMSALRAGLQRSGADVQLAFLDACESGAMTRLKGGHRAPSFVVEVEPDRDARGYVVITSSSALEASQESDELRGSFFTHHLVSGLRGAADRTGDGVVSLEEAYAYAYHRTVAQTAGTRGGTQHPTFTYDLRGNGEVTLTRLGGRGALLFPTAGEGRYLVYDRGRDLVVGEVDKRAGTPARLSVAPGRYVVKKREPNHLLLQEVAVGPAEQRALDESAFSTVGFEDDVTKGPAWLGQRRRLERSWMLDARVGYQAFFDAPSRRDLFHPSALVGAHVEGRNLVAPGLSVHLDAALGGAPAVVQVGPYAEALPVDFFIAVGGVGLAFDWWFADSARLRAGPQLSGVYLRRDFQDEALPFQDLFTISPGAALGADWWLGDLALGLTLRTHYLHYATQAEDRSLGFGEAYLSVGYAP